MKIRPVGAELFHADRRTGRQAHMTKLIVSFGSSVSASENERDVLKSAQSVHWLLYWSHKNKSHGWAAEGFSLSAYFPTPLCPAVISHPVQNLCQCYQEVITSNTARLGVIEGVDESSLPTVTINYYSIRFSYNAYWVVSRDRKYFILTHSLP